MAGAHERLARGSGWRSGSRARARARRRAPPRRAAGTARRGSASAWSHLAGEHEPADVARGDDLAVDLQQRRARRVAKRSSAASRRGSPWARWPKRKFSPTDTCVRAERADQHVVDELLRAARWRTRRRTGSRSAPARPSAAISSALTVERRQQLRRVLRRDHRRPGAARRSARCRRRAITSRWPRCTPSKVPTATLRARGARRRAARVIFTAAQPIASRRRAAARAAWRSVASACSSGDQRRLARHGSPRSRRRAPRRATSNGPIAVRRSSRQ